MLGADKFLIRGVHVRCSGGAPQPAKPSIGSGVGWLRPCSAAMHSSGCRPVSTAGMTWAATRKQGLPVPLSPRYLGMYRRPQSACARVVQAQGRDGGPGGWGDGDLGDGDVAAAQLGVRIKGVGKGQRTNLKGSKRKSRDRDRWAGINQKDTVHLEGGFMARPSTTAELDVHLDAMYVKLGEPLEHTGKDMWLHAAGYDMAAPTRAVAMGPVTIRPVPTAVELLLTDGVIVWNNALMLLVNMGGRKSRRGNKFLDGGARITWFSSPSHEMGDPAIISRLLPDTRAAEQASELPVLLYCRPGKKLPYVFCGQLGNGEVLKDENNREEAGVAADLLAQEEKREKCTRPGNRCIAWTLLDFEELMATSPHFRNMLEFSSVEI